MFTVGESIKLNDEIFNGAGSDPVSQHGRLSYFNFFKDLEFEVINTLTDQNFGLMLEVKCTNDPDFIDAVFFIAEDCVPVSSKLTVDYILNQSSVADLKDREAKLLADRKEMKKKKLPISNPEMRANWKEITTIRNNIEKFKPTTKIFLPKHGLEVENPNISDPDKLTRYLVGEIRKYRRSLRNQNPNVVKTRTLPTLESIKFTTHCGVHTSAGEIAKAQEGIDIKRIDANKVPVKNDKYVGVEIELITSTDSSALKKKLVAARLHYHVHVGTDGSIRPELEGERGLEIRVLATESEMPSVMTKLCKVLAENDCYVNRSCGLHVHLDMRNRDVATAYKNLFLAKDIIRGLQPKHRLENHRYCADNTEENFKNQAGKGRYFTINAESYSKRSTLEIRVGEGSVDAVEINNWIALLISIADAKLSSRVSKIKDVADTIPSVTSDLLEFMSSRAKKCGDILNIA